MHLDKETGFFLRKLEFDYGDKKAEEKLKEPSKKISWLEGWPEDKKAFWNGEAFMWRNRISKEKRELIRKEPGFLEKKDKQKDGSGKKDKKKSREKSEKNLDLGCGSYSYVKSVGFDTAEKMLLLNENLIERVKGDLEKRLPFEDKVFNSATMVFVLDYITNYLDLLREVFRILEKKGQLVVVQSAEEVNIWQRQKAVNRFGFKKWKRILEETGFEVIFYKKEKLGFFKCKKRKII